MSKKKSTSSPKSYSVLGGLVRMARKNAGLSQERLAKKLRMKTASAIWERENGNVCFRHAELWKLAVALKVEYRRLTEAWHLDRARDSETYGETVLGVHMHTRSA